MKGIIFNLSKKDLGKVIDTDEEEKKFLNFYDDLLCMYPDDNSFICDDDEIDYDPLDLAYWNGED